MIATAERTGSFQRQDIGRLLDHAELVAEPRRIGADFADVLHGEKSALRAGANGLSRNRDGARDVVRLVAPRLHHPERDPLRRAWAYPRHLAQLRDQLPDRS